MQFKVIPRTRGDLLQQDNGMRGEIYGNRIIAWSGTTSNRT